MQNMEYQPVSNPQLPPKTRPTPYALTNTWGDYIKLKIEAAVWVAVFLFTFHQSQFVKQLLTNPRVTQPFLTLFFICLGINISVTLFILFLSVETCIFAYQ